MMNQINRANQPNPHIEQLLSLNKGIVDWHTNPNNTVKDIYKHPTLGSKLPVFQTAISNRNAGRVSGRLPGGDMGGRNAANYSKDLELEDQFNRSATAAGILETGLQTELDQAQGNIQSLVMGDENRRNAGLSQAGSLNSWLQQNSKSGWGSFLRGLAGVASSAIGAAGQAGSFGALFAGI